MELAEDDGSVVVGETRMTVVRCHLRLPGVVAVCDFRNDLVQVVVLGRKRTGRRYRK
jgi:hypothetical protein